MMSLPAKPSDHSPPHALWAWLLTACLMLGMIAASPNFRARSNDVQASPLAGDFLQEWISGHMLRHGDQARFYDPEYAQAWEHDTELVGWQWRADDYFPMVYPPFYYALVTPLSYLPFNLAVMIWLLLMAAAFFLSGWLWIKLPSRQPSSLNAWWLPAALLFMPLIENFTSCQKGSLLLLFLTASYALLLRGQSFWAGMVFGCMAFKPQFAVPIAVAMLLKQQWRFVAGGATTGAILVGMCGCLCFDLCQQYWEFSRHAADYVHSGGYDLTKSHSWYGFFTLLIGQGHATAMVKLCTLLAGVLTLGIAIRSLRGELKPGSPRFAYQFSMLVVATILWSPHIYTYDLTMLLLPLGLLWQQRSMCEHPHSQATLSNLALCIFCSVGLSPLVAAHTGCQFSVLMLLALLVALSHAIQPISLANFSLSSDSLALLKNRSPAKSA